MHNPTRKMDEHNRWNGPRFGYAAGIGTVFLLIVAVCFGRVCPVGAQTDKGEDAPSPERVQSAIEGGLSWLAEQQKENGSWPTNKYPNATTGLAGLAFLANGHLPGDEKYGKVVRKAMDFVKQGMKPNGYLGKRGRGNTMYAHAISTLFGLSYLGMAGEEEYDRELAKWNRRSINLILSAQKVPKTKGEQGGWRYDPRSSESDLSVTSWQLLTLHAARQCGYKNFSNGNLQRAFRRGLEFMNGAFRVKTVQKNEETDATEKRIGYVYRPGVSKTPELGVTGAAVFIKRILEKELDSNARRSMKLLRNHTPSWGGTQYKGYFFLGTFYIEQGLFQVGGDAWRSFKPEIQKLLLEHQQGDGHWGFPPDNKKESRRAGPAYPSALAVLILSLDKQYLPMYQRQERLY